jgi:uncharacterized protein (TIGR02598 family)
MKIPLRAHGFSLVEIVLAMGVLSFSIIAMLGLLSLGVNSSKNSFDESMIAAMAREALASLRQQRFGNNALFNNLAAGSAETIYFDINGVRLQQNGADMDKPSAMASGAIYQCTVTAVSGTDRLGPAPAAMGSTPCLLDLVLTFQWPISNHTTNSYSLRTSIARYD